MPCSLSHCADPLKLAKGGRFAKHDWIREKLFHYNWCKKGHLTLVGLLETLGWSSITDLAFRKVIQDYLFRYLAEKILDAVATACNGRSFVIILRRVMSLILLALIALGILQRHCLRCLPLCSSDVAEAPHPPHSPAPVSSICWPNKDVTVNCCCSVKSFET